MVNKEIVDKQEPEVFFKNPLILFFFYLIALFVLFFILIRNFLVL